MKVVTNCRVPGRRKPIQIHLGYLSLRYTGEIPPGQRRKLLNNLKPKWQFHFQTDQVDIDWTDAERKLALLRTLLAGKSDIEDQSTRAAFVPDRHRDDTRGADHLLNANTVFQAPSVDPESPNTSI
ncbi:MAG TPA: hypothetical protein VNO30_40535 [Kofleriaceae bacterium]|nr:hypothetical protein [Kofleriaceae bacterium]